MKRTTLLSCLAIAALALSGSVVRADGHGKDKDKDKDKGNGNGHYYRDKHDDRDDDDDRRGYGYNKHDRDEIRGWYVTNYRHLPPGLAKKDRLPPGLEGRLVIRSQFPPELERQVYVVPVELERRLPPPPPDCERVVIGGHIVLRNRSSRVIVDIFHFD